MTVPSWWEAALLALASYRVFRAIGEDTITERPRKWILDRLEGGRKGRGEYWATFITCPWCAGFWISGVATLIYYAVYVDDSWEAILGFLVTWFAISAAVGLIASVQALVDKHNG